MLKFDSAPVVASIPNCVGGKEFLSRNRKLIGDMRDRGPRGIAGAPARLSAPWGRARSLEGGGSTPFRAVGPRSDPGPCYASTFAAGQPENAKLSDA